MLRLTFITLLAVLVVSVARPGVPVVHAQVFNIADGDVTALRAAITTANSNGEDDVINLADGGLYVITNTADAVDGANGLPSVQADGGHSLTIEGSGATVQRDYGGPTQQFRILHVEEDAELTVRDASLKNGDVDIPAFPDNSGGAIANHGSVTFENVTLQDHLGRNGGAIYNVGILVITDGLIQSNQGNDGTVNNRDGGTLTVTGTTFDDNVAISGGAIFTTAPETTTTIVDSDFTDNRATGAPGSNGGAIYNGAPLSLTDVRFDGNTATDMGGALYATQPHTVQISGGHVRGSDNAPASAAIHNRGMLEIDGTAIEDNLNNGIVNESHVGTIVATLSVMNATIDNNGLRAINNIAGSTAAGVHTANATIQDTTITGHDSYAIQSIAFDPTATGLVSLTVRDSVLSDNGGGILNAADQAMSTADLVVVNTTISGSGAGALHAIRSAAGGADSSSTATIVGSTIEGSGGAGLFNLAASTATGDLRVANSTLSGNNIGIGQQEASGGVANTRIENVTIVESGTDGLTTDGGALAISNTAIGGSGGSNCSISGPGPYTSLANVSDDGTCGGIELLFRAVDDLIVGPLGDNGGPTQTHLPLEGSPLIDEGSQAACDALVDGEGAPLDTDQRGDTFDRTSGPQCDVGAVEVQQADEPPPAEMAPRGYVPMVTKDGV